MVFTLVFKNSRALSKSILDTYSPLVLSSFEIAKIRVSYPFCRP